MTLNASGPISLAGTTAGVSIEIENGGNGTTQISLNDTAVRSLAGVPSGAITMPTNFYGKSNAYTYTISSNQTNFCMRAGAISAGWNGTQALNVTINSGVKISASSSSPAMTISGAYPGGVTVKNNGTIVGLGGSGGNGAGINCVSNYKGSPGGSGSTALKISSTVTICNASGVIAGGGGGGGGGGQGCNFCSGLCRFFPAGGGGGGGGRTSLTNTGGGGGGCVSPFPYNGSPGSGGTYCAAGSGGGGNGSGGSGGSWGAAGSSGGAGSHSGGSGGSGGKATCGTSFVTWTATGTRYGSVS